MNLKQHLNTENSKRKRYEKMCELVNLKPYHTVIDVGCGHGQSFEIYNNVNTVVGIDLEDTCSIERDKFEYVKADGTNLKEFKDKQFDLAISVGVLEHIQPYENLVNMIKEIQRVAKGYIVIVPDKNTILEPHYQLPFWPYYPNWLKKFFARNYNAGIYYKNSTGEYEHLNFFSKKQWQKFFSEGKVITYNYTGLGFVKNTIIYKPVE